MEPRISLITLGVDDLQRSCRFYEAGLGWTVSGASVDDVVFFQLGAMALALYPKTALAADANLPAEGRGFGGIVLSYNVRSRDEVDTVLEKAGAVGATILKPAQEAFWGGYTGYFADPDGYPWEVAWNPGFAIAPDGALQLPA